MSGSTGRFGGAPRALFVTALALLAVVTTATSALAASNTPNPIMSIYTGPGYHEHHGPGGEADVNICSYATDPGFAHCNARLRFDDAATNSAGPPNARGASPSAVPSGSGYGPPDLQAAYGLTSLSATNGAGLTIGIVDAYDNPRAESDLANYRSAAGLPACTTANGCFKKVNQNGASSPLPQGNKSWGQEISLDLDMASAVCPKCKLLLVEASSNSFANLGAAVNRAATMGAVAISNSYGGSEFSSETSSTYAAPYNHPGVAVTASTGDSGYGVQYPAASPSVVAVGGTRLTKSGSTFSETAWSGAGSGCSAYVAKPSWQQDSGCARRTVADVSAVADPSTGVAVYDSYSGGSVWKTFGGTSVSSPIIAAVFALNYTAPYPNAAASYAYGASGSLHDITSGSNGSCGGSYLCTATVGYDGPTGLGTPNGGGAFVSVAPTPDFSLGASPSSMTLNVNAGNSSTINLGALNGYSGSVNLSAQVTAGGAGGLTLTQPTSPAAVPSSSSSVGITANTAGTYTVTVTATDTVNSALTHTTPITVTVNGPDFSIATSPSSLSLAVPPSNGSSTINLTPLNGYSGNLNLSAAVTAGSASGLTLTQPTSPVAATSNAASVGIAANTPGSYTVTVTATDTVDSALTHTATVTVTVASPTPPAPPNFTISATPMVQTVTHGQNATITVTISGSSMGPGGASLSVTGQNASDQIVSWSVNPRTTAGTSVLTLKLGSTTGLRTLTITAANGSYNRTAKVYLLVS